MIEDADSADHSFAEVYERLGEERAKRCYLAQRTDGMFFEFNRAVRSLMLLGKAAKRLSLPPISTVPENAAMSALAADSISVIKDALLAATPNQPEIRCEAVLNIDGQMTRCEISCLTVWNRAQGAPQYTSLIGEIREVRS